MEIKIVKLVLMIVVLLLLLISSLASPIGLIGVAIYLGGMWLYSLKQKGKSYSEKPWMFLTAGAITTIVLVMIFVEPVPEETKADAKSQQLAKKDAEKIKNEQIKKEKEEKKAKELAEKKAKEEAEEKAKLEAEALAKAKEEALKITASTIIRSPILNCKASILSKRTLHDDKKHPNYRYRHRHPRL